MSCFRIPAPGGGVIATSLVEKKGTGTGTLSGTDLVKAEYAVLFQIATAWAKDNQYGDFKCYVHGRQLFNA